MVVTRATRNRFVGVEPARGFESHHLRQKSQYTPDCILCFSFYGGFMDFYRRAKQLEDEIISHRRFLHRNAECGIDLPVTKKYVCDRLKEYGIQPQDCGCGISAAIGRGKPVILLRADMDALPMKEESGEDFASITNAAHTCGHDFHTAMLLGAAKLLKECESELKGTVKLMFQPGEEILAGAKNMIENGILENPVPDAALAFHVAAGNLPGGMFMYNSRDAMMCSCNNFRIVIKGKGGHGAYPHLAIDPVNIAVQIHQAFRNIVPMIKQPDSVCTLSVCRISGGDSPNIIPDNAVMEGALRTDSEECRNKIKDKIMQISSHTAQLYGGSASVSWLADVPSLVCDGKLTEDMAAYLSEMTEAFTTPVADMKAGASEDFACVAEKMPSAMFYISAGFSDERGKFSAHNPKVRFNEEVCAKGAAAYAHCASRWLEENQ